MDKRNNKVASNLLTSLLSAEKVDKKKLKEHLLENFPIIPQEHRLVIWKLMLGN